MDIQSLRCLAEIEVRADQSAQALHISLKFVSGDGIFKELIDILQLAKGQAALEIQTDMVIKIHRFAIRLHMPLEPSGVLAGIIIARVCILETPDIEAGLRSGLFHLAVQRDRKSVV